MLKQAIVSEKVPFVLAGPCPSVFTIRPSSHNQQDLVIS